MDARQREMVVLTLTVSEADRLIGILEEFDFEDEQDFVDSILDVMTDA